MQGRKEEHDLVTGKGGWSLAKCLSLQGDAFVVRIETGEPTKNALFRQDAVTIAA